MKKALLFLQPIAAASSCGPVSNPDFKISKPDLPKSSIWDVTRDEETLYYYLDPKDGDCLLANE